MSRKRFIDGLIGKFNRGPIPKIVIDVSHRTGIEIADIVSKKRKAPIVHARQEVQYIAFKNEVRRQEIYEFFGIDLSILRNSIAAHEARNSLTA